jgi:hypothetical protein
MLLWLVLGEIENTEFDIGTRNRKFARGIRNIGS